MSSIIQRKKFKKTMTYRFGLIGVLTWALTIFMRETSVTQLAPINFILGIIPNISAAWVVVWIGEVIVSYLKKSFDFKYACLSSLIAFLLALVSEVIHHFFLNSPFDNYDMIGTGVALLIYLIVFKIAQTTYK